MRTADSLSRAGRVCGFRGLRLLGLQRFRRDSLRLDYCRCREPSRHVRVRHAGAREVSAVSCSCQRKDAGRAAGWHCCGIVDEVSSAPIFPARMERWHFQKMEEDLRKHASQEPQFRRSSWDRGTLIQSELSPRYFLVLNQRATTSPMNRSGRPHSHV